MTELVRDEASTSSTIDWPLLRTPKVLSHFLKQVSLVWNLKVSQLCNIRMMLVTR